MLALDPFSTSSPTYTIAGLGTNPVTLTLVYNNTTDLADVYVDGVEVIAGYAGNDSAFVGNFVDFGGEDGDFTNVQLCSGLACPAAPASTPEPSSQLLLGIGLLALMAMAWRRNSQASGPTLS